MNKGRKYSILLLETGFNQSHLLSNFIKLTTLFSVFYILVSLVIGFKPGVIIMSCNTSAFLVTLLLFQADKIKFKSAANCYIANCMFVAITLCTFFSGGIYSPVLPWFILVPTISLLLLGISRTTFIWLSLSLTLVVGYGVVGHLGFQYPMDYDKAYWDKIFTTLCIFGLVLIVYLVTHFFETIKQRALHKLSEKNKEITDSIYYARRIQRSLLAPSDLVNEHLPENFVIYKPKDIVSGDFYWAREHDGKFYFAVCDCTGHGVPGAFMSVLITNFLTEAISEKDILRPDEILNFVRRRVIENTASNASQDGMDGVIVCLDSVAGKLSYASANAHSRLVRDGKLTKLNRDKFSVSMSHNMSSFTLNELPLVEGDMLYFYTDGFPDLFGGPKGKKFTTKRMDAKLLEISHKRAFEQQMELEDTYRNWKGDLEQMDDICVVGFRY